MTWKLCDETTTGVNQLKENLNEIEKTERILLIGFTKNFIDAIEPIFDTRPHITLVADVSKHSDSTQKLIHEKCDVVYECDINSNKITPILAKLVPHEFDIVYVEGEMTRKVGPKVFKNVSELQPKNLFWDKTHIDIINIRVGISLQEIKQTTLNTYCHIRYRDINNKKCMLSVLRRFDL